ncbi:hypothetical protein WN51_08488 [Melipona quadrifasciata]|uniref:Uncharacterized protein n=1 Tax=Melipona quadrifasciata TaxID=166423 RepID=A0A0M9A9Q3_9HYME|nr:hypothetical protein WN51_08488 [Melipona quadrifasciata]
MGRGRNYTLWRSNDIVLETPKTGIRDISPAAVKGKTREPQRSGQQCSRFTVALTQCVQRKSFFLYGKTCTKHVVACIEHQRSWNPRPGIPQLRVSNIDWHKPQVAARLASRSCRSPTLSKAVCGTLLGWVINRALAGSCNNKRLWDNLNLLISLTIVLITFPLPEAVRSVIKVKSCEVSASKAQVPIQGVRFQSTNAIHRIISQQKFLMYVTSFSNVLAELLNLPVIVNSTITSQKSLAGERKSNCENLSREEHRFTKLLH